ncbi:MAG: type III pantothenate kinase [Bacteroidales bacterium]|nr:type III pantothenate kinase [Bacteroidales bacterium]
MILCLDIGNSTVFMGLLQGSKVLSFLRVPSSSEAFVGQIANFLDGHTVDRVLLSSVVPSVTPLVEEAVLQVTSLPCSLVKRDLLPPFEIALDEPSSLGADRIADAAGAIHDYALPIIVVDLGTATTFSVIDTQGVFRGGSIGPGIYTSFRAITDKAAQLKDYRLLVPERVIGTNTQDCINSGIVNGHAAMIDGMVTRIEEETGMDYTVVLTGGMSGVVAPFCRRSIKVDETLILRGLYYLYSSSVS